jgi:hypothetical protein
MPGSTLHVFEGDARLTCSGGSSVVKFSGGLGERRSLDWPRWAAIIGNKSALPVYDVRVSFCVPVDTAAGLTWRQGERSLDQVDVVLPGDQHIEIRDHIKAAEEADGNVPGGVAIECTDRNGARWLRDPRRKLTRA